MHTYSRAAKRHMLIPKGVYKDRSSYIAPLPEADLSWLAGELGPDERRAMRQIATVADILTIGDWTFIVAEVAPATIDTLAAFEAEAEDRENDLEDEPGETDGSVDDDLEPEHEGGDPDCNAGPDKAIVLRLRKRLEDRRRNCVGPELVPVRFGRRSMEHMPIVATVVGTVPAWFRGRPPY